MRWLITGFGPFLDVAENPSEHVARALAPRVPGAVIFAPVPVRFGAAAEAVLARARDAGADAIVALGVAGGATGVRVERWGRNRASKDAPDAGGARQTGRPVIEGGPAVLETPLDADTVVRALVRGGVRAVASDDAGAFVCNDLYYRLLAAGARAIFVHVPPRAHEDPRLPAALAGALAALADAPSEGAERTGHG